LQNWSWGVFGKDNQMKGNEAKETFIILAKEGLTKKEVREACLDKLFLIICNLDSSGLCFPKCDSARGTTTNPHAKSSYQAESLQQTPRMGKGKQKNS
jgi:hypothetical protein